jgi:predicted nuclease of predicted toxin-antitoxin system
MKLLLDQDVYEKTARFLIDLEHDVVRVAELGMAQSSDEENLLKAQELERIFVTRDRDYGNLVFIKQIKSGVLYLRVLPSNINSVHAELEIILATYSKKNYTRLLLLSKREDIGSGKYKVAGCNN